MMRILEIKELKHPLSVVISILLCGIIGGQVVISLISNHYKQAMIAHDYQVAGYLSQSLPDQASLATAFTAKKTARDLKRGQALLQSVGYHQRANNQFLPEVKGFQRRYEALVLALSLLLALAIGAVFLATALRQDRKFTQATADIWTIMDGEQRLRLPDHEEGAIAKLFSSINAMSASLTAHITREKQNKEFLRDTIADISHQLKTPLTALKMYNEIMQAEVAGNDIVGAFIQKSGYELERMENLILNLLKLAKLDAGTIELEKRETRLVDFLENCLRGFRTRAELEKKSFTIGCDLGLTLICDPQWLLEAVCNIIKNALDHTGLNGLVEITAAGAAVATRITIRDNGRGIHPEDIHHIFKRFYRSRFSQDKQGVGIGLTLAKAIVEKHGGSITVESEPGKGTVFHLIFPRVQKS